MYARVDGKLCLRTWPTSEWSWASDTFANASTKLPTNGEENALARIRNDSAGVRVSAHVPDESGNKQDALVRRGHSSGHGCACVGRGDLRSPTKSPWPARARFS